MFKHAGVVTILFLGFSQVAAAATSISLVQAEQVALQRDPTTRAFLQQASAEEALSVAQSQLPDPKLQLGVVNLPTDTFDLDQENMTQLKVGLQQAFPSFERLRLRGEQGKDQGMVYQQMAAERRLHLQREVRLIWLEQYYWLQAEKLVSKNREAFEQLLRVTRSLYEIGRNNQHDVIRAELELHNLSDRLLRIKKRYQEEQANLSQWIGQQGETNRVDDVLPNWMAVWHTPLVKTNERDALLSHPKVSAFDAKVSRINKSVAISKTAYSPDWSLNLSYGQRDDVPNGIDRADFFSAMVTVDMPLFTENRQDKRLAASHQKLAVAKDQRLSVLWEMQAQVRREQARSLRLAERHALFEKYLLPQSHDQAIAALFAYQNDQADFGEVVRATMMELETQLDFQRVTIDHLQSLARLRYFLPGNLPSDVAKILPSNVSKSVSNNLLSNVPKKVSSSKSKIMLSHTSSDGLVDVEVEGAL